MVPSSTHPHEPPSPYLRPAALRSALGCRWGARDPREASFPAAARWLPGPAPARREPTARSPEDAPRHVRSGRDAHFRERRADRRRAQGSRSQCRARPAPPAPRPRGTARSRRSGHGRLWPASPLLRARGRKRRPCEAASDAPARGPLRRGDLSRLDSPRPRPPAGALAGTRLGRGSCRPPQTTQFFLMEKGLEKTLLQITHTNGQQTPEEMLNIVSHDGNAH